MIIDDTYHSRKERLYTDYAPSIRSEQTNFKVVEEKQIVREDNVYDAYNDRMLKEGICGTITTHGNSGIRSCGTYCVIEHDEE